MAKGAGGGGRATVTNVMSNPSKYGGLSGVLSRAGTGEGGSAAFQARAVEALYKAAIRRGMPSGGHATLADSIMGQFHDRISRFGTRAYALSDKQIAVIVRELEPWTGKR